MSSTRCGDAATRRCATTRCGPTAGRPTTFRLSARDIERCIEEVRSSRQDIRFAQAQLERFAEAQRASLRDVEIETLPASAGASAHPFASVGAYVPGRRRLPSPLRR
jgi:sulfopropanediol 3-dehydrogenase